MKKKYMIGSVFVALLMLVCTQIVFLNTSKADPVSHTGTAYAGTFWLTQLNVSAVLSTVRNIGVAHANASDDWVYWSNGKGNVTTNYTVQINSQNQRHPEYHLSYEMAIYFVNNKSQCIGTDEFNTTIGANSTCNTTNNLKVPLQFSKSEQDKFHNATLVCLLNAYVWINQTSEAQHFATIAQDRSIIRVDFTPWGVGNFSIYRNYANNVFPGIWSWMPGWENTFGSDEKLMMREQAILNGGQTSVSQGSSQCNSKWTFGHIRADCPNLHITITEISNHTSWYRNVYLNGVPVAARGPFAVSYNNTGDMNGDWQPPVIMRFVVRQNLSRIASKTSLWFRTMNSLGDFWDWGQVGCQYPINRVYLVGRVWAWYKYVVGFARFPDLYINIIGNYSGDSYYSSSDSWTWNNYCASQNISAQLQNGVVLGNIGAKLGSNNNEVYTFKADRGTTRVRLVC